MKKILTGIAAATVLVACAPNDPFAIRDLPKGEQIGIRALVAQNAGKAACTEYQPETQSCASVITSRIVGNELIGTERVAVRNPTGGVSQVEVITRSTIIGVQACVNANGISAGPGSSDAATADATVQFARQRVAAQGGVCGSYFQSGPDYVVTSLGRNGQFFPPGDTSFRYVDGQVNLRAQ